PVTESISQLFSLETGKAVRSLNLRGTGHPEYIFSADGKFLAIAAGEGTSGEVALPVFDTATGDVAMTIRDPGKAIYAAALSPDSKCIVTATGIDQNPGTLALWDGTTGRLHRRLATTESHMVSFSVSSDGKRLAFVDFDHLELRVLDLTNG